MKIKMDYKWVALSVTTVGIFMSSLDMSIVIVGLLRYYRICTRVSCTGYGLSRLYVDDDDTGGHIGPPGGSVRQSQTI